MKVPICDMDTELGRHILETQYLALALVFGAPYGHDANRFESSREVTRFVTAVLEVCGETLYFKDTFEFYLAYKRWYWENQEMLAERGRTPAPPNGGSHTN